MAEDPSQKRTLEALTIAEIAETRNALSQVRRLTIEIRELHSAVALERGRSRAVFALALGSARAMQGIIEQMRPFLERAEHDTSAIQKVGEELERSLDAALKILRGTP